MVSKENKSFIGIVRMIKMFVYVKLGTTSRSRPCGIIWQLEIPLGNLQGNIDFGIIHMRVMIANTWKETIEWHYYCQIIDAEYSELWETGYWT